MILSPGAAWRPRGTAFGLCEINGITATYQGTAKMNGLRREDLDALFPGLLDSVLVAAEGQAKRLSSPSGV